MLAQELDFHNSSEGKAKLAADRDVVILEIDS